MEECKIEHLIHNGFIVELCKGIFGLPQAGLFANLQVKPITSTSYAEVEYCMDGMRRRFGQEL
jgi:hypothetical protein